MHSSLNKKFLFIPPKHTKTLAVHQCQKSFSQTYCETYRDLVFRLRLSPCTGWRVRRGPRPAAPPTSSTGTNNAFLENNIKLIGMFQNRYMYIYINIM